MGVKEVPWWGKAKGAVRSAPYHLRMNDLDYGYATACRGRPMGDSFHHPGDELAKCPRCVEIHANGKERGLWS